MKLIKYLFLNLLLICGGAFANPTCHVQPQTIDLGLQVLGFEGVYVGLTAKNNPVFYNEKTERIYIFEEGLSEPPLEIPWNSSTDLRWLDDPAETRNFNKYKKAGVKSLLSSYGIRCGTSGANPHPKNLQVLSNASKKECVEEEETLPHTGGKCCIGYTFNPNNNKCDEPNLKDPFLKPCTNNSQCEAGKGCLPQNTRVMFSSGTKDLVQLEFLDVMRDELDDQLDESEYLANGKSCTHSYQCESYNCVNKKCEEVKVCRYGEEDEKIDAGTKCDESKYLVKNSKNVCELSPEANHSLFLGLYREGENLLLEDTEAGKCQFKIKDGVKERTEQAIKSLRAMEWMFSSLSRPDSDDCFRLNRKLRDQIGKPFLEMRKALLQDFSTYYSTIKGDYDVIKQALEANQDAQNKSEKVVKIHASLNSAQNTDQEVITQHELASRQSTGYDTLMFMYRRNLLFQSYEKGMIENVALAYDQIAKLNEEIKKWKDNNTSWNLGDELVTAYNCKAMYKKKKFKRGRLKWVDKRHNNVAQRWTDYYEVAGNQANNLNVIKRDAVLEQLRIIGNYDKNEDVIKKFAGHHFLVDPLMPGRTNAMGGLSFTKFGDHKDLNKKSSNKMAMMLGGGAGLAAGGPLGAIMGAAVGKVLGGWGKKKQIRTPRYLYGDQVNKSYTGIRNDFKKRIIDFYREMKINEGQSGFIYEPELVSTDAIDCIDKINNELEGGDKCEEFNQYIEDITDYGMAHFLAFSHHRTGSYSGFFTNANTLRRKLINRLQVDMSNILDYYDAVLKMREKQNGCIESLVNHVADNYLGNGTSLGQGGNYYNGSNNYTGNNTASAKVGGTIGKLNLASRDKYSFKANLSSWKGVADNLINSASSGASKSNVGGSGSSFSESGVLSQSNALNRNRELMERSNNKLSEKGLNFDEKNSSFLASLKDGSKRERSGRGNSYNSLGSSQSSIGSYSSGKGFDLNHQTGMGGDLDLNSGDGDQLASLSPGSLGGSGNSASGFGDGRTYLRESGGGLSYGDDSSAEGGANGANGSYEDPTGMTDYEKSILMANYERTKGRYNPQENDSLFDVVSKAYVRNLNKILTRKKRIEP